MPRQPAAAASNSGRSPWPWLWGWMAAVGGVWGMTPRPSSWRFFDLAARLLIGHAAGGGLHLYASHPELQFGPLTAVVALFFRSVAGRYAPTLVRWTITPLALGVLWLLSDAAGRLRRADRRRLRQMTLLSGLLLMPIWDYLSLSSLHIDDALALTALATALWAIAARRPALHGVALAAAVAAKPWALVFAPLLLVERGRARVLAAVLFAAIVAAAWLPFLVVGHGSIAALRAFTIPNMSTSALRVLGVHTARTPGWVRPAQLVIGFAAGGAAWRRGSWAAVPLAGIGVRLLLDPGAHLYYTASLVVAALAWDLLASPWRWPWAGIAAGALLQPPRIESVPHHLAGILRLVATAGAVVLAVWGPPSPEPAALAPIAPPEPESIEVAA